MDAIQNNIWTEEAMPLDLPAIDPEIAKVEEETVNNLMTRYDQYKTWREGHQEPIWEATFRAYRGKAPDSFYPYQSIYILKEVFKQVEALKPQLADILWPDDRKFEYQSKSDEGSEYAQKSTLVVEDHIKRFNLDQEGLKWLDQCPIWGVSYLRYGWSQYKHIKRKVVKQHSEEKNLWKRETEEEPWDGPSLEWIDPWKVYTDPYVEDIRESPVCVIREMVSGSFLKTMVKEGHYDIDAIQRAYKEVVGAHTLKADSAQQQVEGVEYWLRSINDIDEYEQLHFYTNDGFEYVILGGKILVMGRRCLYGHAPILTLKDYPQPGEHYGLGEPWVLMHDQEFLNDLSSAFMDHIHFNLQPGWKVADTERKNWDYTEFKPGMTVYLSDINKAEMMDSRPLTVDWINTLDFVQRRMELHTGITQESAGTGSDQSTATGIVRLQNAASLRFKHKIRWFLPAFRELYAVLYDLEYRFLDQEVAIKMEGAHDGKYLFSKAGPEVFAPDVDVDVVLPPGLESDQERQQKWLNLWQMLGQDPRVDAEGPFCEMLRAFKIKNPKKWWLSSMQTQQNILDEIKDLEMHGCMRDAKPSDNHQLYIQMLQMFMATPKFSAMNPIAQGAVSYRLEQHNTAMMMMGAAMPNSNSQVTPNPENAGNMMNTETDLNTEAQFSNANTGAQQEGVPVANTGDTGSY